MGWGKGGLRGLDGRVVRQWWVQDILRKDPLKKQLSASIIGLVSGKSFIDLSVWLCISGTPTLHPDTPGNNNGLDRLGDNPQVLKAARIKNC